MTLDTMAETMPDLVAELIQPDRYPPPQPRKVTLATTHASWVFLTDTEAWKVKRPVNYGFLDFSTPDKRRHCCEEEVRLGARLAADVYRGVEPIRRQGGRLGFGFLDDGPVVDWAVRMRRLPDADSALALVRGGALQIAHVERLAHRLVSFYETAAVATDGGEGALAALRGNVDENFAQVRPFVDGLGGIGRVGSAITPAAFEAARAWQTNFLTRAAKDFTRRARAGRVREGHGDLRLEHVYFAGGSPQGEVLVIDPIEFCDRFRWGDVAGEVAFLAMELTLHERRDLAETFLAAFARAGDDYDLYSVVDFFMVYRAWVRAKVACFVAADPATTPDKAARKRQEAASLFALAARLTHARRPRAVVAIGGLPATGKSTVASALGKHLAAPVVSSDEARKRLAGVPLTAHGGAALYSDEHSRRTFEALLAHAESVLASGRSVVLDATFRGAWLRQAARELARRHEARFLFVETTCDEATIRARLEQRAFGTSVSDAGPREHEIIRRAFEAPTELAAEERLVVDGRAPADSIAAAIEARL